MNLKQAGKCLLLTGGLYLGAKVATDDFSDFKKIQIQKESSHVLHNKDVKQDRFVGMEKRIDSMKIVIATKQRIIDSLSISSNYYYTKKISKPQSYGSITYQHQDKITTEILKALSGFDTDALYPDTAKEIVGEQDSVMYKTLWMMNTKYKNPKIGLVEKFDEETTRADYDYRSNTIGLQKNTTSNDLLDQRYYLESWIAELAHAYQIKRDGLKLHKEKMNKDDSLMREQKKTYIDTYKISGTIEYEAHHVIENKLKKEFIATYTSLCDTNNIDHLSMIVALNAGFFEDYYNYGEAQKYIEKIVARDGKIKDRPVLKDIRGHLGYEYEKKRKEDQDEKNRQMAKDCYLIEAKTDEFTYYSISDLYMQKGDIENTIKYYQLSSPSFNKEKAGEIVALNFMKIGKYKEAIQIYEDQAKNGSTYAMFCLMKLYDPKCLNEYEKNFSCKDQEKKEYRENQQIKFKNTKI